MKKLLNVQFSFIEKKQKELENKNNLLKLWLSWVKRDSDNKPLIDLELLNYFPFSSISEKEWTLNNESFYWAYLQFKSFELTSEKKRYFLSLEFFRRHHISCCFKRILLFPKELNYISVRSDLTDGFRNNELGNDNVYRGFIKISYSSLDLALKKLTYFDKNRYFNLVKFYTFKTKKKRKLIFPFYRKTIDKFYNICDQHSIFSLQSLTKNSVHKLFTPELRDNLFYLTVTLLRKNISADPYDYSSVKSLLDLFISKINSPNLFSVIENHKDKAFHFHLVFDYKKLSTHNCLIEKKRKFICKDCSLDYAKLWGLGFIRLRRIGENRYDYHNTIKYILKELEKIGDFFDKVFFSNWYFPSYSKVISNWFKGFIKSDERLKESGIAKKNYLLNNRKKYNILKLKSKLRRKIELNSDHKLNNRWKEKLKNLI